MLVASADTAVDARGSRHGWLAHRSRPALYQVSVRSLAALMGRRLGGKSQTQRLRTPSRASFPRLVTLPQLPSPRVVLLKRSFGILPFQKGLVLVQGTCTPKVSRYARHSQADNRRWLAFRFFNVVSFVYNLRLFNVNRVGPPSRLPQSLCPQHTRSEMALIDNPSAWILRLFEMEAREGRGADCQRFPDGCTLPDVPLDDGEKVFGIYKDKYIFTPQSFAIRLSNGVRRVPWREIRACSTQHGDGKKRSELTLMDGSTLEVRVGDLATGWSGRISQLFHQMIDKYGGATFGIPLYTIEDFFSAADEDDCLAPNLDPHPSLATMRNALIAFRDRPDVSAVLIDVDELNDGVPTANAIVVRTTSSRDDLVDFANALHADGVIEASENIKRKVTAIGSEDKLWQVVWD